MHSDLFRPQALAAQRNRLFGEVIILPSLHTVFWGALMSLWLVATIAWLVSSHYARKVTVDGWLEHPEGITRLYARPTGSRVKQVYVQEGQSVEAGDTLILMNGDKLLASGQSLEHSLLFEYEAQRKLLLAELDDQQVLHERQMSETQSQLAVTVKDIEAIEQQLSTLAQRRALLDERSRRSDEMVTSGHLAKAEKDNLLDQQLHLKHEHQQLVREKLDEQANLAQQHAQLASLPIQHTRDIAALKRELSVLQQHITRLHGERAYTLKAPVSGIVSNLQAKTGQSPGNDLPLLTIVPADSEIAATLTLPVRAAGFVSQGQQIDIRYDAFPYQKFGLFRGHIEQITDSVLLPNEMGVTPIAVDEPVYLVRVKLDSQTVDAFGQAIDLKSGMTFDADIQLAERTILEWLFEPLYSLRGRI